MNNTDQEHAHHHGHHNEELQQLKDFFEKYGKPVVTSIVAVLIVITAIHLYKSRNLSRMAEADARLSSAQSMTDLESIVADYEKSDTAPRALLALAKLYFDNGSYEIALSKYDQFIEKYPEHLMIDGAVVGRLICIEARGDQSSLTEAMNGYESFVLENPDNYLMPQATFGQARCMEEMGQYAGARTIYEGFIAAQTNSPWAMRADELLTSLERKIENSLNKTSTETSAPLVLAPEFSSLTEPKPPANNEVKADGKTE